MAAKAQLYRALCETLPITEVQSLISGVEIVSKSPYSSSFYSAGEITWGSKPHGSYRISDHWNFYSRGEYHCETSNEAKPNSWSLGVYSAETGKYTILKSFEKNFSLHEAKRAARKERKNVVTTFRENRILELSKKLQAERKAAQRAAKIKAGKLWIECEVNVWAGSGRRVKFSGTEVLVGRLVSESKTGNSFVIECENGRRREIRKYNSYKELSRKPYTKKVRVAA